jgi:ribosomal protein S18 acetylase RimI-like enzyme
MTSEGGVRTGSTADLEDLLRLEKSGFAQDQFSRKQINYLLNRANATTYIIQEGGQTRGAAIMLWRRESPIGRLYSITIDPIHQGRGLAKKLLQACEDGALAHGCNRVMLEVRADNRPAIALYERFGYQITDTLRGYYSGGINGLKMIKRLGFEGQPELLLKIPYYAQTLDFTCGSASLMMAMKYFDPGLELNRALELMLWKESTTVFMSAGFGGCGPYGLAVAAQRRGFITRLVMANEQTPFLSSVQSEEKKEVVRIVNNQLKEEARYLGVIEEYKNFTFADIAAAIRRGHIPIVLISTYRLHKDRSPHWVAVTGFNNHNIFYHDPYKEFYEHGSKQAQNVRIPLDQFRQVRRFGKDINKNVIFIEGYRRPKGRPLYSPVLMKESQLKTSG